MPVKKFKDPFSTPAKAVSDKKTLKAPNPASGSELASSAQTPPAATIPPKGPVSSISPKRNKEFFKDKWGKITGRVLEWLDGVDEASQKPRLELLLAESKLKDVAIFAGIGTEKVLLLESQPTQIIGQAEQKKMDDLLPALMQEMKRRGVKAELTERKIEMTLPGGK